jgi:hypothetical protein
MDLTKSSGRPRGRSVALLVAGLLAGTVLIQPAVAHVTRRLSHLYRHLDPRYYNEGQTVDRAQNANNATNAGLLDNIDSTGFLTTGSVVVAGNALSADVDNFTTTAFTSVISTSITAPSNGFLLITGSVGSADDQSLAGQGNLFIRLRVDATATTNDAFPYPAHGADGGGATNDAGTAAASIVVPITSGAHTIHLDAKDQAGSGSYLYNRNISVLFAPSGSGVTIPFRQGPDAGTAGGSSQP